jgi:hypothetical protein
MEELIAEWQPQSGIERALIATMAKAQFEQYRWLEYGIELQGLELDAKRRDKWEEPHLSRVKAEGQAYLMADRWNCVFLRNLWALRDLWRYDLNVTIQGPGR